MQTLLILLPNEGNNSRIITIQSAILANIYNTVDKLLNDKKALEKQVTKFQEIISNFKTERSSEIASSSN